VADRMGLTHRFQLLVVIRQARLQGKPLLIELPEDGFDPVRSASLVLARASVTALSEA
jgi:hypothetical protein